VPSPRKRLLLGAAVACALALSQVAVATASSDPDFGVYRGARTVEAVRQYESWLGTRVDLVVDFIAADSWSSIARPWALKRWNPTKSYHRRYRIVWSVPLLPHSGGTLAEGAAGKFDQHYRSLARALVRAKQGDSILRLGWEFTLGAYPWSVHSDEEARAFAAYFRRVVTIMRMEAPRLQFDWNPANGWAPFDQELAYPGDAYVDFIGVDIYDQSWIEDYTNPAARWKDFLNGDHSLLWYKKFAREHGKPLSHPEWGLSERADGHGGGDSPYFIERMRKWINKENVAYSAYFEFDLGEVKSAMMGGRFPNAATTFRERFGLSREAAVAIFRKSFGLSRTLLD
jgi:hypothetical protein